MTSSSPAPRLGDARRPADGVEPVARAAAVHVHLPAGLAAGARLARVDRDHDRLRAEALGGARDELGIVDGGGVDRHLVGAGEEQPPHVVDRAHAAADGERHEHLVGGARDDVVDDLAPLVRRGDVEEAELVGAGAS